MKRTWVNGKETTWISVYDRGLQYGDGLFETMRMLNGDIAFWPQHLARLQLGCQHLGMTFSQSQLDRQLAVIQQEVGSGVVKLMVTRGESERGYKADSAQKVNLVWLCSDLPSYPETYYSEGVDVLLCRTPLSRNTVLAGLKHLNRLENVMARREWGGEYQEGLMCDDQAHIIEGTMTNVFFIDHGVLVTPDVSGCGVAGIMRQRLLELARQEGIATQIRDIPAIELDDFDAGLVTNSLIGAWPIKTIDTHPYRITPQVQHLVQQLKECQN